MKKSLFKKIILGSLLLMVLVLPQSSFAVNDPSYQFPGVTQSGTMGQTINNNNNVITDTTNTPAGTSKILLAENTSQPSSSASSGCKIPKNIGDLFNYALCILDSAVIPFLVGIGLIIFMAGVLRFVGAGDNEEKRQGGRDMMLFGIIALFVMLSVWGFVNILSNSFFGKNSEIQSLPRKSPTVFSTI